LPAPIPVPHRHLSVEWPSPSFPKASALLYGRPLFSVN
jgi:hypothetical protein